MNNAPRIARPAAAAQVQHLAAIPNLTEPGRLDATIDISQITNFGEIDSQTQTLPLVPVTIMPTATTLSTPSNVAALNVSKQNFFQSTEGIIIIAIAGLCALFLILGVSIFLYRFLRNRSRAKKHEAGRRVKFDDDIKESLLYETRQDNSSYGGSYGYNGSKTELRDASSNPTPEPEEGSWSWFQMWKQNQDDNVKNRAPLPGISHPIYSNPSSKGTVEPERSDSFENASLYTKNTVVSQNFGTLSSSLISELEAQRKGIPPSNKASPISPKPPRTHGASRDNIYNSASLYSNSSPLDSAQSKQANIPSPNQSNPRSDNPEEFRQDSIETESSVYRTVTDYSLYTATTNSSLYSQETKTTSESDSAIQQTPTAASANPFSQFILKIKTDKPESVYSLTTSDLTNSPTATTPTPTAAKQPKHRLAKLKSEDHDDSNNGSLYSKASTPASAQSKFSGFDSLLREYQTTPSVLEEDNRRPSEDSTKK